MREAWPLLIGTPRYIHCEPSDPARRSVATASRQQARSVLSRQCLPGTTALPRPRYEPALEVIARGRRITEKVEKRSSASFRPYTRLIQVWHHSLVLATLLNEKGSRRDLDGAIYEPLTCMNRTG